MKKRILAVFLSLAMIAMLALSVSASEVANYDFSGEPAPISVFWSGNGNAVAELDNGRLKLNDVGDGGFETTNFYSDTLDDFTFSMLYYPNGDWFVDSVYFQWVDANNYYAVKMTGNQNDDASFANTRRTVKLFRKQDNTETEVGSYQFESMPADGNTAYALKIVDKGGDIKVYFAKGTTAPTDPTISYKDASPLATGYIRMFKYCYVSWIDDVVISVPDPEPDPDNPVIKWTFDKAEDIPFEDTFKAGGAIRWEGGKAKIFSQTVGGSGAAVQTGPFGENVDLKDFTWEFDYTPEYLSWNVDNFVFHVKDSFETSLQLRILGNDAAGLTNDVNTTGGGAAHNVKLILRQNGANTLLGSYDLPDGLDLISYSVRIIMKGKNIKVWFAPKSEGLKDAVINCNVDNLPSGMENGHFIINSYFGNFLVDNVSIWNTASPSHLDENGNNKDIEKDEDKDKDKDEEKDEEKDEDKDNEKEDDPSPKTGEESFVLIAILAVCFSCAATVLVAGRKKVRD